MMPPINISLTPAAAALARRISDRAGLLRAMAREIDTQMNLTIAHISTKRMRGNNGKPFPVSEHKLGIRSALLVKSLRASKARISGDTITSSIGSNVKYAGIHEFGGTIKRVLLAGSVRLRTDRRGNLVRRGRNGKLVVFAKRSHKNAVSVAYHGGKRYEVHIPARAPITHGIRDRLAEIGTSLSKAVFNFYRGGAQ